jgi:hypothetical protein
VRSFFEDEGVGVCFPIGTGIFCLLQNVLTLCGGGGALGKEGPSFGVNVAGVSN